jgi:hypothetical protein
MSVGRTFPVCLIDGTLHQGKMEFPIIVPEGIQMVKVSKKLIEAVVVLADIV